MVCRLSTTGKFDSAPALLPPLRVTIIALVSLSLLETKSQDPSEDHQHWRGPQGWLCRLTLSACGARAAARHAKS